MLFQPVLTKCFKSELFLCLPKVDHVIKSCKDFDSKYRSEVVCWRNSKKVCSSNLHKKQCAHPLINTQSFMSAFVSRLIFKHNLSTGQLGFHDQFIYFILIFFTLFINSCKPEICIFILREIETIIVIIIIILSLEMTYYWLLLKSVGKD